MGAADPRCSAKQVRLDSRETVETQRAKFRIRRWRGSK